MRFGRQRLDLVTMSGRELQRIEVLSEVLARRRTEISAAAILGLSTRQTRRLLTAYRDGGGGALIHKARGRTSIPFRSHRHQDTYRGRPRAFWIWQRKFAAAIWITIGWRESHGERDRAQVSSQRQYLARPGRRETLPPRISQHSQRAYGSRANHRG